MKVGIAGYGSTKFSTDDIPLESILLESTIELFNNIQNLDQNDIDVVLVSTNNDSKYLGPILSELVGIKPQISHTVESLCNSGTNAIVSAYSYLASGLARTALVVGADRFDSPGQILRWDNSRGEFKHPIFWASIFAKSYKRKYNVSSQDLAYISVKNHKFAQENPYAYSKKQYSVEDVLESKELTDDIRLLDCSRPCTGGSAVLLSNNDTINKFTDTPVWLTGIGQKNTSASFTKNPSFVSMESTRIASENAFQIASTSPNKVDVAEIHDAFSVCEPLALESLGFIEKGRGTEFSKQLLETNDRRINPRGGIIGSGHPLGATGISQTIEIAEQLQGKAKKRQVDHPRIGLVHNMSAAATSSTVLLFQN
ncbi:MAG: thiolase family protein [Nitrosopumilaceae archaeon]|nr:thiolase family protein [Nitrosopumilaceae archaeon]NIU01574.1 thiolase family protein [Nitrosopumilaceae archaeon]NIU88555.1 thiolase family protein [Nitrosopumilaceae archaeon]NIV66260.1 thiolase family protein [Nitrosopumilaceae archaeon]NIX62176.1 thiolase family protein [Nitrosopumilaceae archaeon]